MPDSKVKELSDNHFSVETKIGARHVAEGAGHPGTEEPGETYDKTAYDPSGCHTERKVELL